MTVSVKFFEIYADSSGTITPDIIGGAPNFNSGYIKQIFISRVSGGGNYVDIQV